MCEPRKEKVHPERLRRCLSIFTSANTVLTARSACAGVQECGVFSNTHVRAVGLLGSRAVRRPRLRVPHTRPNWAPKAPTLAK